VQLETPVHPAAVKGNDMYRTFSLFSCLLLASCAAKPVLIPDIDVNRLMASNTMYLQRIVSENLRSDISMGIAVLVGIDEGDKSYVALSPTPSAARSNYLQIVDFSMIRTLDIDQAKELLRVIDYAIENYDLNVSRLESINASFQSALQSQSLEFQGSTLAPVTSDLLTFTFVNIDGGSEAVMDFGGEAGARHGTKKLNREKLELLGSLMSGAIERIDTQETH
jgi:hypothetical protein